MVIKFPWDKYLELFDAFALIFIFIALSDLNMEQNSIPDYEMIMFMILLFIAAFLHIIKSFNIHKNKSESNK